MIADTVASSSAARVWFHRAMDHAGAVIGPLIGYVLVLFFVANASRRRRRVFEDLSGCVVPALARVLVAIFFMRESPATRRTDRDQKLSLRGFDSNFKRFLVVLALFTLSNSSTVF
jgi:hypothetical protein